MDCKRVRTLLPGYIDGELDLVTALDIQEHLKTCSDCMREYTAMLELQTVLAQQRKELFHSAPADLQRRVHSALLKASGERSRPVPRLAWPMAAAAAFLVVLVLVALFLTNGWLNPRKEVVAEEVEIAHVRSLMADHLTDVVSSDQHTVKPWFDSKLDFSPPVVNLAAQGFPLAGGRLDYIDVHPAAALIYMRNKHIINLLIWPTADPPAGIQNLTINGYHLYHWNQSGMAFWAVSDLDNGELKNFVELIQKNIP